MALTFSQKATTFLTITANRERKRDKTMSFEECKANDFYNEKGQLDIDSASYLFVSSEKEELLSLDKTVLADVIIESREVFSKAVDAGYAASTLLAACMSALLHENKTLHEMFLRLTDNGTRNMTQKELFSLIQGFVIAEGDTLNTLRTVEAMLDGEI